MNRNQVRGYFLALLAALLWGVSGTFAQFLFTEKKIDTEWLVTVRLLIAGTLFLIVATAQNRKEVTQIIRENFWSLYSFGIFGMLAVQYTYFAAIEHSNAATATVLQYLGPVLIALYYAFKDKRIPRLVEIIGVVLAVGGTFFLVTHGSLDSLSISVTALVLGLLSAVALAYYSIAPVELLKKYSAATVVGWSMLIGGLAFSFFHLPWRVEGIWDGDTYLSVGLIVIFGTLIPFYSYLTSVRLVGAKTTSLLACAEPLSAAVLAVLWLGVPFGAYDWLGSAMIISTIALLAVFSPGKNQDQN